MRKGIIEGSNYEHPSDTFPLKGKILGTPGAVMMMAYMNIPMNCSTGIKVNGCLPDNKRLYLIH